MDVRLCADAQNDYAYVAERKSEVERTIIAQCTAKMP
jgi:hypothetical protein